MHYTTELLIEGNDDILTYYKNALDRWKKILFNNQNANSEELAKILTNEQSWFESNCGSRWVGQEIMVVTGICQFYTTALGFDKNEKKAKLIYDAFMKSYCSLEVKGMAEDVARRYFS
jgi:hypothetical protein